MKKYGIWFEKFESLEKDSPRDGELLKFIYEENKRIAARNLTRVAILVTLFGIFVAIFSCTPTSQPVKPVVVEYVTPDTIYTPGGFYFGMTSTQVWDGLDDKPGLCIVFEGKHPEHWDSSLSTYIH